PSYHRPYLSYYALRFPPSCITSCHRHHRPLHSFPTRRSSDLWYANNARKLLHDEKISLHMFPHKKSYLRFYPRGVIGIIAPWNIDRKSTRLNSSHQIISYAVFCLKKKKTSSEYTSS